MTEASSDDPLALGTRSGLPDALRVLLDTYPREAWEADPHFTGLVSFWLQRHMMFRQILARLTAETQAVLDRRSDPARFAPTLAQLGSVFVGELHGHHHIEDAVYFPKLAAQDARVAPGFEILDRDHQALDGILDGFVTAANGVIRSQPTEFLPGAGAFLTDLGRIEGLLDRHLTDEEELVVPVILKYGDSGLH